MYLYQVIAIVAVLVVFAFIHILILKRFGVKLYLSAVFIVPLCFFSLGFILRLSYSRIYVDLGYYFTDSSSLFISSLFGAFLLLGQTKYWKK